MKKLLSVIIPVYNDAQGLERCVKSVIFQSYESIEIILVNDGSTDSTGLICDRLKKRYSCITVIHKKRGGLGSARNMGIDIAKGDYVAFLDSYVYVHGDIYSRLISYAQCYGLDIVECGLKKSQKFNRDELEVSLSELFIVGKREALVNNYNWNQFSIKYWNKIYKTEVLRNIKFPDNEVCEDEHFTWKAFNNASKLGSITSKMVCHQQNDKMNTINECVSFINAYKERLSFDKESDYELYQIGEKRYIEIMFQRMEWLVYNTRPWKIKKHVLYEYMKELSSFDDAVYIAMYPSYRRRRAISLLRKRKFVFRVLFSFYVKYIKNISIV